MANQSTHAPTGDDLVWGSHQDPDVARCPYCATADCPTPFEHERDARNNEYTYWSAAVRPRDFSARAAA